VLIVISNIFHVSADGISVRAINGSRFSSGFSLSENRGVNTGILAILQGHADLALVLSGLVKVVVIDLRLIVYLCHGQHVDHVRLCECGDLPENWQSAGGIVNYVYEVDEVIVA
jgi:hypothetical protein